MERNWMLFMLFAFIVVSAGFVSIHNVREDRRSAEEIGGANLEKVDLSTCSEEAQLASGRVFPVYSCESRQLDDFTVVDLGSKPLNDCTSGCFAAEYRFVVEGDTTQLVGTRYGGKAEYVTGVDSIPSGITLVDLDELPMDASVDNLTRQISESGESFSPPTPE